MRNSLKVDVLNIKGEKSGKIKLPEEIFGAKINESLMAQAVRVYLHNQWQGTASTKTRGEVAGSRRKIWRQKGTGRARHGDRYAPIFVGGGVAHGPKGRDWRLKMSKKMRRAALFSALSRRLKEKAILVIGNLEEIKPKTKIMAATLEKILGKKPKKVMLVLPQKIEKVRRAGRNIPYLTLEQANLLHTYEVLSHDKLIFMKEAIPLLKKTFLKKN